MVFQDNELISTIRNEKWRTTMNIFDHRQFVASGGWSTFTMQYWSAGFAYWMVGGTSLFFKQSLQKGFLWNNKDLALINVSAIVLGYFLGRSMGI